MNNQNASQRLIENNGVARVLAACAVVGAGLMFASLVPNASPVILGRCAYAAGRVMRSR